MVPGVNGRMGWWVNAATLDVLGGPYFLRHTPRLPPVGLAGVA